MPFFVRTLSAAGAARLESLRRTPALAGELIYRGRVFGPGATADAPLFTYERRVGRSADGLTSAHITQAPDGAVLIAEEAWFDECYALQHFAATNRQLGYTGSVAVGRGGRRLDYRLERNGRLHTAAEEVADPVVSGPSLHGFILQHWSTLLQGRRMAVRMIVLAKLQTYGFTIRLLAERDGRVAFTVEPCRWWVRLAVAPLTVTFDAATRHVLRYEGRVPPMALRDGKLRTLDARVDYTMAVPAYR